MTRRHMSDPGHTVEPARREHRPGVTGCDVAVKPARQPWLASPGARSASPGGRPPGTPRQAEGTGGVRVRPVSDLQRRGAALPGVADNEPPRGPPRAPPRHDHPPPPRAPDTPP